MSSFVVRLHKKESGQRDEYMTRANEFVGGNKASTWTKFDEAQRAAMRARLQDSQGRLVTIDEV